MKPHIVYKLTDQNICTYCGFQWIVNQWAPPLNGIRLCTPGVYHAYHTAELALLLNPIHSNFRASRLWKAEVKGRIIDTDYGLKLGATEMRLLEEMPFTPPTAEQRITFALLCAKEVCRDPEFTLFADSWVSGKDRTAATAEAAARAAWAEQAAAWVAWTTETSAWAAQAAAWAAEAAVRAARAADVAVRAVRAVRAARAAELAAEAAAGAARAAEHPLEMLKRCSKAAYTL